MLSWVRSPQPVYVARRCEVMLTSSLPEYMTYSYGLRRGTVIDIGPEASLSLDGAYVDDLFLS